MVLHLPVRGQITGIEQVDALPIGAVITPTSQIDNENRPQYNYYEVRDGDEVRSRDGSQYRNADFAGGGYSVLSLPDGYTPPETSPETVMTFEMFRQEFVTCIIGGARSHGISIDPVFSALRSAGLPLYPDPLLPGMMLNTADTEMGRNGRIPVGTIIRSGSSRNLDVVGMGQHGWTSIYGRGALGDRTYEVIHVPGREQWSGLTPQPDDEQKIAEFKSEMWVLGLAAKQANSWCPSFEAVMSRMGISADSRIMDVGEIGSVVTPAQARALPMGSLFTYTTRPDDSGRTTEVLVIRNGARSNAAGTQRIGHTNRDFESQLGHLKNAGMRVIHNPDRVSTPFVPLNQATMGGPGHLHTARILDALPPGSRVSLRTYNAGDWYVKCRDGRWSDRQVDWANVDGQLSMDSFGMAWGITYIPGHFGSEQ